MLRLVSLLGFACLAVAAASLASTNAEVRVQDEENLETYNRLPAEIVAVVPACPTFHAPFSLN
jgi:hypothetical protein